MELQTTDTADAPTGIDIEAASDQIGAELFPSTEPEPDEALVAEAVQAKGAEATLETTPDMTQATTPDTTAKLAPKSWPKEMHDHWGKVPPEVQTYWETREKQMLDGLDQYKTDAAFTKQFRDALTPYRQTLQQLGVDELTAAKSLFQADHILRYSPPDQKRTYFEQLAKNYGIDLSQGMTPQGDPAQLSDLRVQQLEQQIQHITQTVTAQQRDAMQTARTKISHEVDAFASDPKHDLFNDCYEDIVKFITAGDSLQEAYDKAVWANPVTREKQVLTRIQTEAEKAKERARLDGLPKNKAKSVNMRGRDTLRAPTEPLGSMEDTMQKTLVSIRSKTIH